MKTLPIALLLSCCACAQTVFPTLWWTNTTSSMGVLQWRSEYLRLGDTASGFVEGTHTLPHAGPWEYRLGVHTDETFSSSSEYVRFYVNGTLIQEVNNTPVNVAYPITTIFTGTSVTFRFEFSSPFSQIGMHSVVDPGVIVDPSAIPGTALFADVSQVSVSASGCQKLWIHGGPSHDGWDYYLLGSLSGSFPGVPLGPWHLPLNFDAYTTWTLFMPDPNLLVESQNAFNYLGFTRPLTYLPVLAGELPPVAVNVPPGLPPTLAGLILNHAVVALDPMTMAVMNTSNAVGLTLVP